MLVLSRHIGEEIVIGEGVNQVVVRLVQIRGDKARLGVEARPDVPVHRREVYEAIKRKGEIK
jgi:carbon storage regulator